jgi:hypothetical protein
LKLVLAFSLFIKGVNPHNEIKGSNPSPGAFILRALANTIKPMKAKIPPKLELKFTP